MDRFAVLTSSDAGHDRMPQSRTRRALCLPMMLALLAVTALSLGLTGCTMGNVQLSGPVTQSAGAAVTLKGNVHGGQQPVSGATIQLYAAGTTGYGAGATALILAGSYAPGGAPGCTTGCNATVVSDAGGNFTITGDYTCPVVPNGGVSQLYLVATGGNPGGSASGNDPNGNAYTSFSNPNLALMAALGPCGSGATLSASQTIMINEYTTVAAVAALQQFMAAPASANSLAPAVGAPSNSYNNVPVSQQGLTNAFAMAGNLADVSTGLAPAPGSTPVVNGVTTESTKIGLIADILASCINSGSSADTAYPASTSTACSTLFTDAQPVGATYAPTDTIQAAWYMLQSASYYAPFVEDSGTPTATSKGTATNGATAFATYVNNLVGLSSAVAPYAAATSATDFTIAVAYAPTYNSGAAYGISTPLYVAIDPYGNAWFPNQGTAASGSGTASVSEVSPTGALLLDPVTNFTVSSTGGATSLFTAQPSSTARTFQGPRTLSIDPSGVVWVPNFNDSIGSTPLGGDIASFAASSGAGVASSGSTGGYFVGYLPYMAAIDGSGNLYITHAGNSTSSDVGGKAFGELTTGGVFTLDTTGKSSSANPNYFLSTSTSKGLLYPALDANSNGSSVWIVDNQACKFGSTAVYGAIGQFTTSLVPSAASFYSNGQGKTSCLAGNTTGDNGVNTMLTAVSFNMAGVAVDKSNNLWWADQYTSGTGGFDGLTYATQTISSSTLTGSFSYVDNGAAAGTNITNPQNIAIDGNSSVWVANGGIGAVTEASYVSGTGVVLNSPPGGFAHTFLATPSGIAIDASGNVWVTNTSTSTVANTAGTYTGGYLGSNGTGISSGNAVVVLVGAAAPVIPTQSLAVKSNAIGVKP